VEIISVSVAVASVWLLLLTLVVLALVRQVGLLTMRIDRGMPRFAADQDGPEIGAPVPGDVLAALPQLAGTGRRQVLLLSAVCGPCRELAVELGKSTVDGQLLALVPGHSEAADVLISLLPPDVAVVRDPDAIAIAKALAIRSTPFAVEVESGTVTGKAYLKELADLARLIEAGRNGRRRIPASREVASGATPAK
jgi:hypothetical protein